MEEESSGKWKDEKEKSMDQSGNKTVKNRSWQGVKESMAVKRTAEVGAFQLRLGVLVRS